MNVVVTVNIDMVGINIFSIIVVVIIINILTIILHLITKSSRIVRNGKYTRSGEIVIKEIEKYEK